MNTWQPVLARLYAVAGLVLVFLVASVARA